MAKETQNPIQVQFFEKIQSMIPPSVSLADVMSDLLDITTSSAYRRIRGESSLSLDEMFNLCKQLGISMDALARTGKGNVTFSYESFAAKALDIDAYLKNIICKLEELKHLPDIHIYFAAENVPVFHHFEFDEMTAFKFFFWQKSIANDPDYKEKKIDFNTTSKDTLLLAKKAYELYNQIPSTEIWTVETINSTIMQVRYYWDMGLFLSKEDALLICNQMIQMVEHIQVQAESGKKSNKKKQEVPFHMYVSEVMVGNSSVLGVANDFKISLLTFNTFNSLTTSDNWFCNDSEIWMRNTIKNSMLLAGVSGKQRFQFFKKIVDLIEELKRHIEG